jgi:transposase
MNVGADKSEPLTAIHTDLGAIFVSLELSRSSWLITSLSPGGGEKMSKHSVRGGDFAGLMERFAQLQEKARLRTGQSFRIIVVQEAGLDGFWIHRALQNEDIESHVVDAASIATSRRRRRAKTDKIDGETLVRALLAYKRGEPRVCAMVKVPTPGEEDRRHLCRERKALTAERVRHVNRIKGFLFSQGVSGYQPLRRDRRQRLEELQTGDGRAFPPHLKALINRELDRLELLLKQIKTVEAARDALLAIEQTAKPAPAAMLLDIRGIGPEFAAILWSEGLFRHFENRRQIAAYAGLAPTLAERRSRSRTGNVQSRQPATANNIDPARLAMAAQSAALSSQRLVSRTGKPQRGPPAQDNHRGISAKAAGRALEIRDRRCRYRRSYDEGCLTNTPT